MQEGLDMLIQFRFKNFKSFRDEQVLSMVASTDKTMLESNTSPEPALGKQSLVRTSVIYGSNASGKSNVINAFAFVRAFVVSSVDKPVDAEIPVEPFRLEKTSANSPSEFEVTFIDHGVRYQYGFSVNRKKVFSEWLIAYPKGLPQKWFERTLDSSKGDSDWYFGPQLKGEKERLVSLTRPDVLFLALASKFNHKQLSTVYHWFQDHLRTIRADDDAHFFYTAKQINADSATQQQVKRLLEFADFGIVDFFVKERQSLPDDMPEELRSLIAKGDAEWSGSFDVQFKHRGKDADANELVFPLEQESKGTQRLFCISGPWVHTLNQGYTLVADELGASLHPNLVKELVRMFHDKNVNPKNAQLIFNTHDTTLLDSAIFRRDQIWFVKKDNSGASHLYPLLEFSPRKEESLGKGYLRGRYGAVPILSEFNLIEA
jgi:uncharacterized protein